MKYYAINKRFLVITYGSTNDEAFNKAMNIVSTIEYSALKDDEEFTERAINGIRDIEMYVCNDGEEIILLSNGEVITI